MSLISHLLIIIIPRKQLHQVPIFNFVVCLHSSLKVVGILTHSPFCSCTLVLLEIFNFHWNMLLITLLNFLKLKWFHFAHSSFCATLLQRWLQFASQSYHLSFLARLFLGQLKSACYLVESIIAILMLVLGLDRQPHR